MSERRTDRNGVPVSPLRAALVLTFGLLLGLAVGEFFHETIWHEPWGRVLTVAMGGCACLGGILRLMQDGVETE